MGELLKLPLACRGTTEARKRGPDPWKKREETTRSRLSPPPDHKGGWHQEKLVPPAHMGSVGLEGFCPPNPPVFLPLYSHPRLTGLHILYIAAMHEDRQCTLPNTKSIPCHPAEFFLTLLADNSTAVAS